MSTVAAGTRVQNDHTIRETNTLEIVSQSVLTLPLELQLGKMSLAICQVGTGQFPFGFPKVERLIVVVGRMRHLATDGCRAVGS